MNFFHHYLRRIEYYKSNFKKYLEFEKMIIFDKFVLIFKLFLKIFNFREIPVCTFRMF